MKAPVAKRIAYRHELHGDVREDDYAWLTNREDPDVIALLEAENNYYDEVMQPLTPFVETLYEEMVARVPEEEKAVPVKHGAYYYYVRTEKAWQYPLYARKKATSREALIHAEEETLLNLNDLAKEGDYLSVTVMRISPDHTRLAYLENRDGTDAYTLYIKDLRTGELLLDSVSDIFIEDSLAWDARGEALYYITIDEAQRPYRLWRHTLGTTVQTDELLYEETDTTCILVLNKTRSGRFIVVTSATKTSSEVFYIDTVQPQKGLQRFAARKENVLVEIEHWQDQFLILTNENAVNFRLAVCPIDQGEPITDLIHHDPKRFLAGIYPFADHLLLTGREDGLTQVWLFEQDSLQPLSFDEPIYTVYVGQNRAYSTDEVLLTYTSLLTPHTTIAYDLQTKKKEILQVAPIAGPYDQAQYVQERLFAKADDGVNVPMLVVYHEDALNHGPAPLILYAYGSYGYSIDPDFDAQRLPLLDRGVIYVIAQIRGGSEMGRTWYEDGKLLQKRNTFTDYIAVAKNLIDRGYTTAKQMAGMGASAGGLLMGAVANMGGEYFNVLIPMVPFVDVVTTMLDASIPLTTLEWDEWGNPEDKTFYDYMKSYSPYDNVEAKAYPHMLVTTGLNDPRVAYFEPAKWVAKLRRDKTDDHTLLLKTHMGAGHFGSSERFAHLREMAEISAFVLHHLGVTTKA